MDEDDFDQDELAEQEDQEQAEQEELEEMEAMSEAERQAEERAIKNKLKRLLTKVKTRNIIHIINPDDIKTMRTARKMGAKFKPDLMQIEVARAINIQKTTAKAMSCAPALYYIAIIALIILIAAVVIIAVGALASFVSNLFSGDGSEESVAGVTGKDFYGVRVAYQNESLASTQMIEDYVNLVVSGAEKIQQTTSANVNGTQYALQLNLNCELPTQYDYSKFDEASFSGSYSIVYNASFEIAKNIYKQDNEADFAGSSLVDCTKGIKYFGYEDVNTLAELTAQTLLENTTIQATQNGEAVTNGATINEIKDKLTQNVANELSGEFSHLEVRAEKLFVKDIILEEDDKKVSGITKENYVYFMFMPKRQVNFSSFSFVVGGEDLQGFEMSANYNGVDYVVEAHDDNMGDDNFDGYFYEIDDVNVNVNEFTDIDKNNLKALSEPTSIFEILVNSSLNKDLYLQMSTIEDVSVYSLKTSGFTVKTSNPTPFVIAEYETLWE